MTGDLIERLEKASEGDRELDGLIYGSEHGLALNGCTFMLEIHGRETFQFQHPTLRHPNGPAALYVAGYDVGPVTNSLDAALALAERVLGDDAEIDATDALARALIDMTCFGFRADRPIAPQVAMRVCVIVLKATPPASSSSQGTVQGGEK